VVWQDSEGEGYWADRDRVRLVVRKGQGGRWDRWLLVPSSGGSVYRAREASLWKAKGSLGVYATDFLKDVYGVEPAESVSLVWHPIGAGGRFVLFQAGGELLIEECNPGDEGGCVRAHNGTLVSAHGSRADAEARRLASASR